MGILGRKISSKLLHITIIMLHIRIRGFLRKLIRRKIGKQLRL